MPPRLAKARLEHDGVRRRCFRPSCATTTRAESTAWGEKTYEKTPPHFVGTAWIADRVAGLDQRTALLALRHPPVTVLPERDVRGLVVERILERTCA